jgi:hypothetical protein
VLARVLLDGLRVLGLLLGLGLGLGLGLPL